MTKYQVFSTFIKDLTWWETFTDLPEYLKLQFKENSTMGFQYSCILSAWRVTEDFTCKVQIIPSPFYNSLHAFRLHAILRAFFFGGGLHKEGEISKNCPSALQQWNFFHSCYKCLGYNFVVLKHLFVGAVQALQSSASDPSLYTKLTRAQIHKQWFWKIYTTDHHKKGLEIPMHWMTLQFQFGWSVYSMHEQEPELFTIKKGDWLRNLTHYTGNSNFIHPILSFPER